MSFWIVPFQAQSGRKGPRFSLNLLILLALVLFLYSTLHFLNQRWFRGFDTF